jgi:hypothetical protein
MSNYFLPNIFFLSSGCRENSIFGENNIFDGKVQSWTEFDCKEKCQKTAECKFWTWSNQKECFLKDKTALNQRVNNDYYVSGTSNCPGKSLQVKEI